MIASLATGIGIEMGLPTEEIERIRIASLLHDLGKIAIPEEILDKPRPSPLGPIDLMVGAGGVAALTLFAWFVLLPPGDVGQRRRTDRSTMSGPGAEALPKRK